MATIIKKQGNEDDYIDPLVEYDDIPILCTPKLDTPEVHALARVNFGNFVEILFPVLHPGRRLKHASYLEVLADCLMSVAEGREKRVIMNLPPRHMKSMLTSVFYTAWRLGLDPSAKFICISYGDDLAHELSAATRRVMKSEIYKSIFPGTVLEKQAEDHIKTTKGGARYATSVGSDITGFGADEIIIDDPMQPDQATSESSKEKVRSWVQNSVLTRFNDPAKGALILVMHRLAPDDLSATFEATGNYLVLKFPLVAEQEEAIYDVHGRWRHYRKPGDVLNPTHLSPAEVERLRSELPANVFTSQYQQRPTIGGSGMLQISLFRRYDSENRPKFELYMHSWDIAGTVTGNATVGTVWGLTTEGGKDHVYLLDVIRVKLELPAVRALIKAKNKENQPAIIIIDERGIGLGIYQDLISDKIPNAVRSTDKASPIEWPSDHEGRPSASKVDRFGQSIIAIDDGRVWLPKKAPWLDEFIGEVAAFPNSKYNDQVDSMTQVLFRLDNTIRRARQNIRSFGIPQTHGQVSPQSRRRLRHHTFV